MVATPYGYGTRGSSGVWLPSETLRGAVAWILALEMAIDQRVVSEVIVDDVLPNGTVEHYNNITT